MYIIDTWHSLVPSITEDTLKSEMPLYRAEFHARPILSWCSFSIASQKLPMCSFISAISLWLSLQCLQCLLFLFSLTGRTRFLSMARCAEAARALTYQWSSEQDYENSAWSSLIGEDALLFAKSVYYEIQPDFFASSHLYKPLRCSSRLINLGTTSFQHATDIISEVTKHRLFSCVFTGVRVDKTTRKASAIPQDFLRTFWSNMDTCYVPRMNKLKTPENCFKVDLITDWGDSDPYLHVNQAAYLGYTAKMLQSCLHRPTNYMLMTAVKWSLSMVYIYPKLLLEIDSLFQCGKKANVFALMFIMKQNKQQPTKHLLTWQNLYSIISEFWDWLSFLS